MAGGPNASIVMCVHCTGKASRFYEGVEDDWYLCDECGKDFGIDWSRKQPETPCWPPTPEELEEARRVLALMGKPRSTASEEGSVKDHDRKFRKVRIGIVLYASCAAYGGLVGLIVGLVIVFTFFGARGFGEDMVTFNGAALGLLAGAIAGLFAGAALSATISE